jgi:hypothetical protein
MTSPKNNKRWFLERRRLSHDWLGNRLLPKLRSLNNIFLGEVEDSIGLKKARTFLETEWPANISSLRSLIESCMDSVGPSALIDSNPYFLECDPTLRQMIAEVVDRDFQLNSKIRQQLLVVDRCLRECETCYGTVTAVLSALNGSELAPDLREPLLEFTQKCEALANSLNHLPHSYELPTLSITG